MTRTDKGTSGNVISVQEDIPYELGRMIGKGASAKVYALKDTTDTISRGTSQKKREADCVKVICTEDLLSEKEQLLTALRGKDYGRKIHQILYRQCLREVSIMRDLKDTGHVVRIKDARTQSGRENGGYTLQIRMERLTPLTEYLKGHSVTRQLVLRLGQDLCRALMDCKEKGIIHQDIKISNIFVTDEGSFKLGDFGIACYKEDANHFYAAGGTLSTMAPEVCRGNKASFVSDLYSLGIVLYALMNNGLDPFINTPEEQLDAVKRRRALEKRMQPHTLPAPSMADEKLAGIICRACAYDPGHRYPSAAAMLADLEAGLTGRSCAVKNRSYSSSPCTVM